MEYALNSITLCDVFNNVHNYRDPRFERQAPRDLPTGVLYSVLLMQCAVKKSLNKFLVNCVSLIMQYVDTESDSKEVLIVC